VPGGQRIGVTIPIGLERASVPVKLPAVEFNDHLLVWKEGVDLAAGDDRAHDRRRESVPRAPGWEAVLPGRAGRAAFEVDEGFE
jgi:hypothetical protein